MGCVWRVAIGRIPVWGVTIHIVEIRDTAVPDSGVRRLTPVELEVLPRAAPKGDTYGDSCRDDNGKHKARQ